MFGHLHQWLILGKNLEHTVRLLNDSTFSITTDFVISLPRDDAYVLYDIYNHCKHCGGPLSVTNFGTVGRYGTPSADNLQIGETVPLW